MVAPTNDSVAPPPGGYLVKEILEIRPGQTLFAPFDRNGVQGIKADNMNGGTVVVVLSPYAVGVAYLISPSETNGDNSPLTEEQAEATMLQFRELYRQHAQYFPPEKQEALYDREKTSHTISGADAGLQDKYKARDACGISMCRPVLASNSEKSYC
ncbi:hypothetical protein Plec18167_006569 [Paecilomyces lecythidis]|uniref:Uncharacterized protein n=1 Tax=Paecilomyces lecythidis TaxID=3004212 RepID=A0ABR3XAF8_9EURO